MSGLFDEVIMQTFEEAYVPIQTDLVVGFVQNVETLDYALLKQNLKNYNGPVIALGQFYKVAPQFPDWESKNYLPVHTIANLTLNSLTMLHHVQVDKNSQVLNYAIGYNEEIPLIVQHNEHRALFLEHYTQLDAQIIMNNLFTLYSGKYENSKHPSYIIVEHINPLTDIEKLTEVANELINRNIPILLSISSIYTNNELKTSATLSDSDPLVRLLIELQRQGAIIIVNDYIDYDIDAMNYGVNTEQAFTVFNRNPGQSTSQLNEQQTRLNGKENFSTAIQILVQKNLLPSAFYNQNGRLFQADYLEMADYTSTFFGKLSLAGDASGENQGPLFISNPNLLNRQKLFPITLSPPQDQYDNPLLTMKNEIERVMQVDNAVLSTTFSMYDELSTLSAILSTIENVPNMYWYDFQQEPFLIHTDKFQVENMEGIYKVQSSWTTIDELKWRFRDRPLEIVLWVLVFLPIGFVVLFTGNIFFLRLRYRKNLFEERT